MTPEQIVIGLQWFFLCYFVALHGGYLMLNVLAALAMSRAMGRRVLDELPRGFGRFEPPISVLVPAYNESGSIVGSLRSLLQLSYSEYELVVINDGSRDDTLAALMQAFDLRPFPEAYRVRLPTQPVRSVYRSLKYPNLRVIDKENGGKADALNAGINAARYPLFCAVDADSILQRDSLSRVVQPFLEDPLTVASGGTVRIANGCEISGGFLQKAGLPRHPLALIQIMEYLRAFLFGRLGWVPLNALLIISGAFGVFNKERVVAAGGYRHDTVGEDMELVVRLHRQLRQAGIPYRIHFLPDPICWTEAPEDLRTLKNQRIRWQTGLAQSLMMNRSLLFHRRGGWAGWLAFPIMLGNDAEIIAAADAAEARQAMTARRYHLVILDLGLPDDPGTQLLAELRQCQPLTPVLVFSSQELSRELSEQVAGLLIKSRTSHELLLDSIRKLLHRQALPMLAEIPEKTE